MCQYVQECFYIFRLYEDCEEGGIISNLSDIFHLTFSLHAKQPYLLGGAKSDNFNVEELMMLINPIVCISGTQLYKMRCDSQSWSLTHIT